MASLSKRLRSSANTLCIVSVLPSMSVEGRRPLPLAVSSAANAEVFDIYVE
jgi:hypothetical protein